MVSRTDSDVALRSIKGLMPLLSLINRGEKICNTILNGIPKRQNLMLKSITFHLNKPLLYSKTNELYQFVIMCLPIAISTIIWYIKSMKIDKDKVILLCKKNRLSLQQMLDKAKVSRNAYYSLIRKDSILPKSMIHIAEVLEVSPKVLVEKEGISQQKARSIIKKMEKILQKNKYADPDNIRHTLLLLEEKPIVRLRRALLRGQKFNIYR